jgi:signal peptidase I
MTHPQDRVSPQVQPHAQSQEQENAVLELLKTLGLSIVLAFGIRTFVAEARYIPSASMIPTLKINDRLIVDKITYHFQDLHRGDIVVFKPTEKLKQEGYKDAFIKRVIGLPGEVIKIQEGSLYVDGKLLSENYIAGAEDLGLGELKGLQIDRGTSVDVCNNRPTFFNRKQEGDKAVWEATIPADSYLVLGDNRNNSYDSRCWGVVQRNDIIGRAVVRFWPPNRVGGINPEQVYPADSQQ